MHQHLEHSWPSIAAKANGREVMERSHCSWNRWLMRYEGTRELRRRVLRAFDVFFSFLFLDRLIKGCGTLPLIKSGTKLDVGLWHHLLVSSKHGFHDDYCVPGKTTHTRGRSSGRHIPHAVTQTERHLLEVVRFWTSNFEGTNGPD